MAFHVSINQISCYKLNILSQGTCTDQKSLSSDDHLVIDDHQFLISKEGLSELPELNHTDFLQRGGIQNIVSALKTNVDTGITGDERDLYFRRKAFGSNLNSQDQPSSTSSSSQRGESLKRLLLHACRDTTIILLFCCAILSLVIGIKRNGLEEGFIDGAFIFLAVSIVISFEAIFRLFKARRMMKKSLSPKKKVLWVVRNGKFRMIPDFDIVVGDIIWLHTGDQVPADGIFIDGDLMQLNDGLDQNPCPFLFYGANLVRGYCRMLVTSVGDNTERSKLIQQQNDHDHQESKQQLLDAIDKTNSKLEKIWLSISLVVLVVELIRCFVIGHEENKPDSKSGKKELEGLMNESLKMMTKHAGLKTNGLASMLCILLFVSRDGLALAISISLLYASHKMKSCEAIIQKLPSSATIGLVTTICITGKTNDLVLDHTKMADLWVGLTLIDNVHRQVDNEILDFLREGILCGEEDFYLFTWAKAVLGINMEFHGEKCSVVQHEMTPLPDINAQKGAPEHVLSLCSHYFNGDGTVETLDDNRRILFLQIIDNLVSSNGHQSCFAFAYRQEIDEVDIDNSRPDQELVREEEEETVQPSENGFILLGLVGLKNPYTPEVIEAVEDCRKSGIKIKLLVDDDINTAKIMAMNSGVLTPEEDVDDGELGAIIEGCDFRTGSEEERMNMVDNIHVMANSTPADKLLMIQCLKQKGETVAAVASCTRDSPLLKEANVGIFMGAEVSMEDADILVVNKNFSKVPGIINLGIRVCENLKKFITLQLTLEISAFIINLMAVAAKRAEVEELISSFQLLWINLVVEVLGALAVAITTVHTQSPHKPGSVYGSGRVITGTMYRSIGVQSFFQVIIVLILGVEGKGMFGLAALKTMVFNCYGLCQVFLLFPGIEILKKKDIVIMGLFLFIVGIIGIVQVAVIEVMAVLAHWAKLDVKQWWICIGIASFSVPLRCVTDWIFM